MGGAGRPTFGDIERALLDARRCARRAAENADLQPAASEWDSFCTALAGREAAATPMAPGAGTPTGGLAAWRLERVCAAMEARLGGKLRLTELAAAAGVSPTHLSRAFRRSTGLTLSAWRLERRVRLAKTLLARADVELSEIALASGFAAQPQFTTAFRRATGATPGAWRRAAAR